MTEYTVTAPGGGRHQTYGDYQTLHRADCPTLPRARRNRPTYLDGWVLVADGRPVVGNPHALRDDDIAVGSSVAYGKPQEYRSDPTARAGRARFYADEAAEHPESYRVCGRCKPNPTKEEATP